MSTVVDLVVVLVVGWYSLGLAAAVGLLWLRMMRTSHLDSPDTAHGQEDDSALQDFDNPPHASSAA